MHMPGNNLQTKAMESMFYILSHICHTIIFTDYRFTDLQIGLCSGGSAKPPTLSSPPGGIPDGEIPCRQFLMLGRKNNKETLIVYIRFLDAVLDRYEDVQGICANCIYCNK